MNEFRQALDAHAAGQLDLPGLERALNLGLTRQPQLAPAHGALVEALYRSGRIAGESYLKLTQAIRAFQQSQPRVSVQVAPVSAGGASADDKTQFRAPKAATQTPAAPAASDAEKTQFRAPRAAAAAANAASTNTAGGNATGLGTINAGAAGTNAANHGAPHTNATDTGAQSSFAPPTGTGGFT